MHAQRRIHIHGSRSSTSGALLLLLLTGLTGCGEEVKELPPLRADTTPKASVTDLQDAPRSREGAMLLDLAFKAASAMPENPHVKTRCRLMADVVETWQALSMPAKAAAMATQITNWRRGLALADLAYHCAENGVEDLARSYIEKARQALATMSPADAQQEWRGDRIKARLAAVHILLGDNETALELQKDLVPSESGKAAAAVARRAKESDYKELRAVLLHGKDTAPLDHLENLIAAHVEIYRSLYQNKAIRDEVASDIREAGKRLPIPIRLAHLHALALIAFEKKDAALAITFGEDAKALLDSMRSTAEHRVPETARLASLQARIGQTEQARASLLASLALFDLEIHTIMEMDRTEVLLPVAEAFAVLGDHDRAEDTYRRALHEAGRNPNARPRAEDLVAVACSVAKSGIKVSGALLAALEQLQSGLAHPW
ncbi:MAG TPA: hypothetical protein PKA37_00585 [Planctomycetota bacterium]|nr:hypothetical protein [Planctomycetota bacterium]